MGDYVVVDDDDDNDEDGKELIVKYEVRDVSKNEKELIREIVFDVDSDIDSIWYLEWCAVDNDKSYCSKQSFSKSESIKTSILTNIGYDFVIIDEHNLYEWKLANFNDVRPDKDSFVIQINASIPPSANPKIIDLMQYIKNNKLNAWKHRIDENNQLYISSSIDKTDKLMAEKIRSILLKEYKANKVDITQKIDENSFSGSLNTNDRWSFSSNSTLFVFMAIVLCGGILVGFQKKISLQISRCLFKIDKQTKSKQDSKYIH